MRILCCLDGTNARQVSKATEMLSAAEASTFGILFVTDTGPRHDIGRGTMEEWKGCILPIIHSSILPPQVERAASPTISAFRVRRYAHTPTPRPLWLRLRRAMESMVYLRRAQSRRRAASYLP